jgi:hypothetical protein
MKLIPPLALLSALGVASCSPQSAPDPRIGAIADRLAIDQLVAGDYPRALDAHDWDAYTALFTDDGELALGPQKAKGRDAMKELLRGLPAEPKVIHVISNLSYTISGDTATGGAYWQDTGIGTKHGLLAAGHYNDTLRKVNGAWRFTKREIVVQLQDDSAAPAASE